MKRYAVLVLLFMGIMLSATSLPAQRFTLTIWVDKGCGGDYFVGDMLTVNWRVSHNCEIIFWEIEPDGFKRRLHSGPVITTAGEGSRGWTLKDYGYGKRAIYAEATSIWGRDSDQCEFYVHKKAAEVQITVTDQDGEPISGADIMINGTSVATTTTAGTATLSDVEFGEHLIEVRVGEEKQSSPIRIASIQKQYLDFVFTVEKRGSIQVSVSDQKGAPLPQVDIYIDGYREGHTDSSGMITVSVAEGTHFVEAKADGETQERSVIVERGKTTPVDFTVYLSMETTIEVLVMDEQGNPVSDAGVYTDNVFLGRTDAGGRVYQKSTSGFHALRVEKEGYTSHVEDIMLQEGENKLTVTITAEKDTPLYGILSVIGILYILKRHQ
jgi:protocatechuate 3,4-dioxygenase beta subunit